MSLWEHLLLQSRQRRRVSPCQSRAETLLQVFFLWWNVFHHWDSLYSLICISFVKQCLLMWRHWSSACKTLLSPSWLVDALIHSVKVWKNSEVWEVKGLLFRGVLLAFCVKTLLPKVFFFFFVRFMARKDAIAHETVWGLRGVRMFWRKLFVFVNQQRSFYYF